MARVLDETTIKKPVILDRVITSKPTVRLERLKQAIISHQVIPNRHAEGASSFL
jgi:hypothetical protein